jgi:hypothetical protein
MPDFVSATQTVLLNGERLFSPAALAKASNVPGHRGGEHLNGSTVFRQITKGVRAANGELVRLEAVRLGCRWLTSLEALARFAQKLTAAQINAGKPSADSPSPESPKQRARKQSDASAELDRLLGPRRDPESG